MTTGAAIRRERMVRELRDTHGIENEAVLDAMRRIPREPFVDETLHGNAYADTSLPIGDGQTISQPAVVARMSELVGPDPRGRVLEIGTGSGYQTAVLSRLFELVYTVERIPALGERARRTIRELGIENVHFKIFDGGFGWSEFKPYDAILVTAAVPSMPSPLIDQLADGGRLVAPVDAVTGADQIMTRWVKRGASLPEETHGPSRFVPLVGRFGRGTE